MAKILITWELGGGLGHLLPIRCLATQLDAMGHSIALALRKTRHVAPFFSPASWPMLPAPVHRPRGPAVVAGVATFAHMLLNNGFADPDELQQRCQAWRKVYDDVQPDIVLFDHSPTAMLAARGLPVATATLGTGFCCPADRTPLPNWRPWLNYSEQALADAEARVVRNINVVLRGGGTPPLDRIGQLYASVDQQFLQTYPELDHFSDRGDARYWGIVPYAGGEEPVWPAGVGARIFAYLKPSASARTIMHYLAMLRLPTLVFSPGLDPALIAAYQQRYSTIRFAAEPLDLSRVCQQCDAAVHQGTHGVTAASLLAAKPAVVFPHFLEQQITADSLRRCGAARSADPNNETALLDALHDGLVSPAYRRRRSDLRNNTDAGRHRRICCVWQTRSPRTGPRRCKRETKRMPLQALHASLVACRRKRVCQIRANFFS